MYKNRYIDLWIDIADKTKNVEDVLSTKGYFYLVGESEGPVTSSQREAVIVLASHPFREERQDPCNSVKASWCE